MSIKIGTVAFSPELSAAEVRQWWETMAPAYARAGYLLEAVDARLEPQAPPAPADGPAEPRDHAGRSRSPAP
jgi:hypothetical protein